MEKRKTAAQIFIQEILQKAPDHKQIIWREVYWILYQKFYQGSYHILCNHQIEAIVCTVLLSVAGILLPGNTVVDIPKSMEVQEWLEWYQEEAESQKWLERLNENFVTE